MRIIPAALAAFLLAPPLAADVFTHAEAGLQFELPEGWQTAEQGDTLEATSPDETAIMWFDVIGESEVDTYFKTLERDTNKLLKEMKVTTDGRVGSVNGLRQVFSEGTAMLDGQEVDWDLTIVQGGKKVLAILAAGDDLEDAVVKKIYNSIRKPERPAAR